MMEILKKQARKENSLLGRIIKFPCVDNYAIYVITKVNKSTVKIEWVDYGDRWVDDRCGKAAMIDIVYAKHKVKSEDMMDKLFSK